jgi:8-oxo-dGTP pyrophosphatase MutT (NUDIX family)
MSKALETRSTSLCWTKTLAGGGMCEVSCPMAGDWMALGDRLIINAVVARREVLASTIRCGVKDRRWDHRRYGEPGEERAAAQRELREETGYEAPRWTSLGDFLVDPNRGIAVGHLFLAQDAHYVGPGIVDDLEEQHLLLLSQAEMEAALETGEIKILAWAAAVAFALRKLLVKG